MPRTRVSKDYDKLIKDSEQKILKLTEELKNEKLIKKKLEKEKISYEKMIQKRKDDEEIKQIANLIKSSGRTLDEVKELLSK